MKWATRSVVHIDRAACAWLIRRDSGHWTQLDESQLQSWLEASSLHRVAFWRLEMAWEEAARLKALGAGVASHQPPPRGDWNLTPFFNLHVAGSADANPTGHIAPADVQPALQICPPLARSFVDRLGLPPL